MIKKKFFLLTVLLLAFIFSCQMPSSSSVRNRGILERYPYFNIKLVGIESKDNKNHPITKDDKILAIKTLALLKLAVSTPEFEEEVMKTAPLYSHYAGVYPGGNYNIEEHEKSTKELDKKRVLMTIREAQFSTTYIKSTENGTFRGEMGELSYAFHGYRDYGKGTYIWGGHNRWKLNELNWFASSAFHEHMHNLGYTHIGNNGGVPYIVGTDIMNPLTKRILEGDLKSKYAADLEELTNLYLKMYEKL